MRARFPGFVVALTLVVGSMATSLAPSVATTATSTDPTGIDVSHYQGTISWGAVASDGVDFAIIKATEGRKYVDPRFASNRTNAQLAGVTVGMYHVASPSKSTDDARAEADHFLSVAAPGIGNVIPALDIEISNVPDGMSPTTLGAWIKAWLHRVTTTLGVRPMIYGSQYLFVTMLANSTWFADHGIDLWFAWPRTPLPNRMPANDWQGQSWTFWQWSWTGSIAGIAGDVDRDRFAGSNLLTQTIASVSATPGTGGAIADASGRLSCADGASCSSLYSPADPVHLTATPDDGFAFVSWGGACASFGADPACSITALGAKTVTATFSYALHVHVKGNGRGSVASAPAGIDCPGDCSATYGPGASVTLTASPDQWSGLTWSGDCSGTDPNGCTVTMDQPRDVTATIVDLGAATATIKAPGSRSGALVVTLDEPVRHVNTSNVVIRPKGGKQIGARLRCSDGSGDPTPCATGRVRRAVLQPRNALSRHTDYVAMVDPAGVGPVVDRVANPVALTRRLFSFG
jgi:GH25 family lysozyme M1 (1,4-beta-N-acetylmuramidase)